MKLVFFLIFIFAFIAKAEVITKINTHEKIVAITLDACETKTPSYVDHEIVDYLIKKRIPFTLFVNGKFLRRNKEDLKNLYSTGLVSIQNHSMNHFQHMENLSDRDIVFEVKAVEILIKELTNKKPIYFRFPGGNYDERSLRIVESLGYKVVHWTFASGDPDPHVTPEKLVSHVVSNTKPGSIVIFHANGRGYSTKKALPIIVEELMRKGYSFVRLEDYIK